jgi:chromosome segregation protein
VFLKSLTLKGFKSFAEPTTLDFEPGVTVVVGPNGSGKSNVVDAMAWVLGAQGPRTVRSSKMDDVIFAGSSKRPALGRAEVSMVIDNSAGRLPVPMSEITISRTLFRTGESEYAINGATCRLLDIQELLSDSGVGRQQHVIVSQGQLDSVLNSRPEDRRLMIEEAAGVLKYRRRRERAERRLEATEGNLLRLQDLLREVRRQLRPLERQAEAARRHGDLVAELARVRLYVAGRELAELEARRDANAEQRRLLAGEEGELRNGLSRLDAGVMAAEAELSRLRAGDVAEVLTRLEALRERARGLAALLGERRRSLERSRDAVIDEGLAASLEAEGDELRRGLGEVEAELSEWSGRRGEAAQAEQAAEAELTAFLDGAGLDGDGAGVGGEEAAIRERLSGLRQALERDRRSLAHLDQRIADMQARASGLESERQGLVAEREGAGAEMDAATRQLDEVSSARSGAEAAAEAAEEAARRAEGEAHRWAARVEALSQSLDEARLAPGRQQVEGLEGVLGPLADLVEVDPGFDAAFEAGCGESLPAVVVEGPGPAGQALDHLKRAGAAGAILASAPSSGPPVAPPGPAGPPAGSEALLAHLRSGSPSVQALLERLLAGVVVVGGDWRQALDVHLERPDLVVVTREGDRLSSRGWRTGPAGAAGARQALEEARRAAEATADEADGRARDLGEARKTLSAGQVAQADAARRADRAAGRMAAVDEALERAGSWLADVGRQLQAAAEQRHQIADRVEHDSSSIAHLEQVLPGLEERVSAAAEAAEEARAARRHLEESAAACRSRRQEAEVRVAGLSERRDVLAGRLAEVERRLGEVDGVGAPDAARRRRRLEESILAVDRLSSLVGRRLAQLEEDAADHRARHRDQAEALEALGRRLDSLRSERAETERQLGVLRERTQRAEIEEAEVRLRLETALEALRRDLDKEPEEAVAAPPPDLSPGVSPRQRERELEREIRLMGAINPLALEELTSLSERHQLLEGQLEDVRSARRELGKVIRAIDAEIVEVFASAYADVADNFTNLFATLFPGGQGQLRLTDPTDLLGTGIEIEARPPGRNVRRLSLLSGGERSLVALAFLFAIFRSRPSPFYVMDEVEAALDDVNLVRFLDLVHEFRAESQLIIVSHQKRTMEAADSLYGVSMQAGGASKVVSERMRQAEPA